MKEAAATEGRLTPNLSGFDVLELGVFADACEALSNATRSAKGDENSQNRFGVEVVVLARFLLTGRRTLAGA
jgi:hypothetical protein